MTDNDWRNAMIEEARRSVLTMDYERAYQGGLVGRLADALEAAEKALGEATVTPTDGEREELANLIPLDLVHDRDRDGFPSDVFEAADRILAAGFRRSEVPEPRVSAGSAFPTTDEVRDAWVDHMSLMPDDVPAMQEIFDGWLARTLKEEGAANSAETVKTAPEPQGEPSDAQEYECRQDRACAFGSHSVECDEYNRAALRAALTVGEVR